MIVERHNVKKGDMIVTDIGSGILMRETRAYWFYLFKNRMNRIKKSQFWQMVDCGMIKVEYADNKKYRRIQKRYRTLDIRDVSLDDVESELAEFLKFVKHPSSIVFGPNASDKASIVLDCLSRSGLDFYEEKGFSSDLRPVIKILG